MFAVAAAAVPLALYAVQASRRERFQRLAAYHASRVLGIHAIGTEGKKYRHWSRTPDGAILTSSQIRRDLWHIELSIKYRAAANQPLWPITTDPPPPD